MIINGIAFGFSAAFLISAFIAALYTGEFGSVFHNWYLILISPCPLVTDYFEIGGLASTMLNAGACGMACFLAMILLKGESHPNTLAGYFLVVAHCFYGLNFLNMWPCFLAPFLYLRMKKLDFNNNLHVCMFATSFGPFISEFLFRYTQGDSFRFGEVSLTASGIAITIGFALMIGFIIPAILPGAKAWHKGYNLYNGGLAFGLLGLFIFAFMYKTFGIEVPDAFTVPNPIYESHGNSYFEFVVPFFIFTFVSLLLFGWYLNGKSFKGYDELLNSTGHDANFFDQYGAPFVFINLGFYGLMILTYFAIVILATDGAGFTGATTGIILAAITFTAKGQHPRNVFPVLMGYVILSAIVSGICVLIGLDIPWTLSTQGYMNGAAFATGLCPIAGHYGKRYGVLAGMMCAVICTSTSAMHGGLMLYNGGLSAGITALILIPCLEYYKNEN
jgi:hypothetical protein